MAKISVLLALLFAGCAAFIQVPPRLAPGNDFCSVENFDGYTFVNDGSVMLRFAQPTKGNLSCLRDLYKLTDVFQLDMGRDPAVPGITNHYHPLSVLTATEADVDAVMADMVKTCDKPGAVCGIHCAHGQDRTGLLSALWLLRHSGTDPDAVDAVYADLTRHGFHPYDALFNIFKKKVGW